MIAPGSWVQCVEPWPKPPFPIAKGSVHRVDRIWQSAEDCALHGTRCGSVAVTLEGIATGEGAYCLQQFRSMHRPAEEQIRQEEVVA